MRHLDVARLAAKSAGELIAHYYREGVTMSEKGPGDLVSKADIEAEGIIARIIHEAFPTDEILGEEGHKASPDADCLWVVDPLDGTTNFAHHIPHFAVSIAYHKRGVPIVGVIHNPITGDWYTAARGEGAFANGKPARVNDHTRIDQTLVAAGFFSDRGQLLESTFAGLQDFCREGAHGIRRFGAASLDFCGVGLGHFGIYFELLLNAWDFAAGRLFVEEAGGKVTTITGDPLPTARSSILATNGLLHDAALGLCSKRAVPTSYQPG
jgi:myo-inositol-1(or 4)-monophosphatase